MDDLFGYFLMWAVAGAIIGGFCDKDNLLVGALKGLAIAVFPIYVILLIMVHMVMWPVARLFGVEDKYDAVVKKISIF